MEAVPLGDLEMWNRCPSFGCKSTLSQREFDEEAELLLVRLTTKVVFETKLKARQKPELEALVRHGIIVPKLTVVFRLQDEAATIFPFLKAFA